jgi:hypothetical protein
MTTSGPPSPSAYEQLRAAANAFEHLALNAPKEDVELGFDQMRALLLKVMMDAPDSYPYELSWNTLTRFGDAKLDALMAIEEGSPAYEDTMVHLKHLVASAMDLLP